jgi:hypothetical protein
VQPPGPVGNLPTELIRTCVRSSWGHERIALKRFWIDLDRGRVSAAVNGSIGDVGRVDVFRLAESKRPGLGDVRLVMTRTAAGALNSTFDVKRFSKGDNFGFAKVRLAS